MDTTVKQVSPVEYELSISATAAELMPRIDNELRQHKSKITLKGFRKGKVPIKIVKKMYGKELAYGIAEKSIQEQYESEILDKGDHEVLGQPKVTELEYEMDGDLHAVIRFGVRPEFTLADVGGSINKLVHDVSDDDIDKELEAVRYQFAEFVETDSPVTEDDAVTADMQEIDAVADVAIEDEFREDVKLSLFDENLQPDLKESLLGAKVGDTVRVAITRHKGEPTENTVHFDVTIKEIERREVPELDDQLASKASGGRFESVDDLKAEVSKNLTAQWEQRSRQLLESTIVKKLTDAHVFEIPSSVIELYQDSFIEELKQRSGGTLPPTFDEQGYREYRKDEAEQQSRWMLIRDKIVDEEKLEVTDEDREKFFSESAETEGMDAELLKNYYTSIPNLGTQLNQQLLSKKVFSLLESKFEIVELDREAYEKALEVDEPS